MPILVVISDLGICFVVMLLSLTLAGGLDRTAVAGVKIWSGIQIVEATSHIIIESVNIVMNPAFSDFTQQYDTYFMKIKWQMLLPRCQELKMLFAPGLE